MRSPRQPARRCLLLAAGSALALAACAPAPSPWRQVDLAFADHRLEALDGRALAGGARRVIVPLGPADLRAVAGAAGDTTAATAPAVAAGRVMALVQPADTRLVVPLAVDPPAFVEFRPLLAADSCHCRHRVLLRAGGGEREVWRSAEPVASWPPPELVQLPLAAAAGGDLELVFELASVGTPAGGDGLWASPRVASRSGAEPPRRAAGEQRPNIVLIGADTLRADAVGAYGRSPSLTPALDALAAESDVWLEAFSTFNITVPSFTSMLTGLYGRQHGVYENTDRAAPELLTVAEVLAPRGYATAAFLSARHLATGGLGQGFATVSAPAGHQAGELAVNQAMNWLAEAPEPFFLWVHLYDPHTPHTPPGRHAEGYVAAAPSGLLAPARWLAFRPPGPIAFRDRKLMGHEDLYAGEVAYLDRQVDRLLDVLRSRDGLEETLVAFVSDHGENLGEHQGIAFQHVGLWDTVVRVPMMIRWPGRERAGRRLGGLVSTLDLFPTLLRAAGAAPPPSSGLDLEQLTRDGGRRAVFAEQGNDRGPMIRTATGKYFTTRFNYLIAGGEYLYDLDRDAAEGRRLEPGATDLDDRLRPALARWQRDAARLVPSESTALTAAELAELRALGYLE